MRVNRSYHGRDGPIGSARSHISFPGEALSVVGGKLPAFAEPLRRPPASHGAGRRSRGWESRATSQAPRSGYSNFMSPKSGAVVRARPSYENSKGHWVQYHADQFGAGIATLNSGIP